MSKITDIVNDIIVKTNANTSGQNIHNATSKATPVDADELAILDSVSSFSLKKLTWANLKNVIFSSPALTGTPTAPTQTASDNSTKIATTSFAQPRLVSGTNIKTINGASILGTGNITSGDLSTTSISLAGNGYMRLSNGLIIQWGYVSAGASGDVSATFPVAFPHACFSVVIASFNAADGATNESVVQSISTTTVQFNRSGGGAIGIYWFAIGH